MMNFFKSLFLTEIDFFIPNRMFQQFSFYLVDYFKASSCDIWMRKCHLSCHNQGKYLIEYMQVAKH